MIRRSDVQSASKATHPRFDGGDDEWPDADIHLLDEVGEYITYFDEWPDDEDTIPSEGGVIPCEIGSSGLVDYDDPRWQWMWREVP